MKLILGGLVLLFVVVIGAVTLLGDQRYHTTYLTPQISSSWKIPAPLQRQKAGQKSRSVCEVMFTYPLECHIFPNSVPASTRLEYQASWIRVLVRAADLQDPDNGRTGEWKGFSRSLLRNRVLIQVSVWSKHAGTSVSLDKTRIRCDDSVTKLLVPKRSQFYRYTMLRILPSGTYDMPDKAGFQVGALLIDADPAKTTDCQLSFVDAIRSASGQAVADLKLKAMPVAYYRPII